MKVIDADCQSVYAVILALIYSINWQKLMHSQLSLSADRRQCTYYYRHC